MHWLQHVCSPAAPESSRWLIRRVQYRQMAIGLQEHSQQRMPLKRVHISPLQITQDGETGCVVQLIRLSVSYIEQLG